MINPSTPDFKNTPISPRRPYFQYELENLILEPQVSIVTPFFNTGAVFHETAESVMRQSFQQWEWLIVNDRSESPEALEVLAAYRRRDPRIRVIDHAENRGPGAARNTGFHAARSSRIVQLDSDNLLEPTAIETWLWFLEAFPEYGFVKGYTVGFGAQHYLWTDGFHNGPAFLYKNHVDATAMICKSVHTAVGGYDESIRSGLEDWEFWLRCANSGYWGGTVPQFLDWYRRRPSHKDRWKDWDEGARQQNFLTQLRRRYPVLWNGKFPHIEPQAQLANHPIPAGLPYENRLAKSRPRLLMLVPWLTMGGADRFNLNLLKQLAGRDWEITIATTLEGDNAWQAEFAALTPDIFILNSFLNLINYPRFLRYLARSRQVDYVLISNSELSYQLLPYLRAHLPEVVFLDYCHMEEENWKNGGYPRMSLQYGEALDLQIVSSQHLQKWMIDSGGAPERIKTCYTNIEVPLSPVETAGEHPPSPVGQPPLIVYAGRICEQKQPQVFAQTMLSLSQQGLPFRAVVAGDGPDLKRLHMFIQQHRLSRQIEILGEVSYERMRALMAEADIFFLPSRWEGISLAIYEAMASGLAIVAADVGGQGELVTPECGLLIRPGGEASEVRGYTAALARLLQEPELIWKMGQAGRERITEHFRLDQLGDSMVALLEEAARLSLDQPRPRPSLGLAEAIANQAVEYMRLAKLADQLWMARNGHPVFQNHERASLQALDWRKRLYLRLYLWHEPIYRWYSNRGWTWVTPVRERIKQVFLRPAKY